MYATLYVVLALLGLSATVISGHLSPQKTRASLFRLVRSIRNALMTFSSNARSLDPSELSSDADVMVMDK